MFTRTVVFKSSPHEFYIFADFKDGEDVVLFYDVPYGCDIQSIILNWIEKGILPE